MKKITMLLMGLFLVLCFAVVGMSAVPDQTQKNYTLQGETVSDSQNLEKGQFALSGEVLSVYGLTLAIDQNKVDIYTLIKIKNHNYYTNTGNKETKGVLVACRSCFKARGRTQI